MSEAATTEYCSKCERELDDQGNCPKHWPPTLDALTQYRRQTVVNKVAKKTSIAEDLLTVHDSSIGSTVERLLDALAGLVITSSAARAKTHDAVRNKPQHAPLPPRQSAWADEVAGQVDNQLWEITENLTSFLNRPTDPQMYAGCDTCGNRRVSDSASYCSNCGSRILAGAKRCRTPGCPNNGQRRARCPQTLPSPTGMIPHPG